MMPVFGRRTFSAQHPIVWLTGSLCGYNVRCGSANQANSAFHLSRAGNCIVIHVFTWSTGVETSKQQAMGLCTAVWPKTVTASLGCGLRCTRALSDHVMPALLRWYMRQLWRYISYFYLYILRLKFGLRSSFTFCEVTHCLRLPQHFKLHRCLFSSSKLVAIFHKNKRNLWAILAHTKFIETTKWQYHLHMLR